MASHVPLPPRRVPSFLVVCFLVLVAWRCFKGSDHQIDEASGNFPAASELSVDLSSVRAPFISWPLARVCSEAHWTPGIVFLCDNNSGGIGNIRNAILTCLRYAIEAGATGLVLPTIRTRSETDLTALWQEPLPFDYFFDEAHFRSSLAAACPQITVYPNTYEILGVQQPDKFEPVKPKDFGASRADCNYGFPNMLAHSFGTKFRQWAAEKEKEFLLPPLSMMDRRVFRLTWGAQFEWPAWIDGPEFVATYGGLLRFRPDILDVGASVVALMKAFAASGDRKGTHFVGMHLRTEHDALPAWPTFEDQTAAYLQEVQRGEFTAGYLATGNASQAAMFKRQALQDANLHVVTKEDLLSGQPEETTLNALTWDQRALVDFVVLMDADYFLGMNPSTFSMTVALKRHLQMEGIHTRPWKVGKEDGRSRLVGNFHQYWDSWLWFYDTMWP
jgi:hypothetical protein